MLSSSKIPRQCLLSFTCLVRMKSSTIKHGSRQTKTRVKQQLIHKQNKICLSMDNLVNNAEGSNETAVLPEQFENLYYEIQVKSSQLLGFNDKELFKRVNMLHKCGMTMKDSLAISLSIPSCFNINNNNFKSILKVLKKFKLPREKLLFFNPNIGAISCEVITQNLTHLTQLELKHDLGELLLEYPILLSYPLNKSAIELLKKVNFDIDNSSTSSEMLKTAMQQRTLQNAEMSDTLSGKLKPLTRLFSNAIEFLNNYDLDILQIFKIAPDFFFTDVEVLMKCQNVVLSEPFCLSAEEIEQLLTNYPDVFLTLASKEIEHLVEYILSVTVSKDRLYKLLIKQPEIFRDTDTFFNRVKIFSKYGINSSNIGRLLAQKGGVTCFTACQDFTDDSLNNILNLYLFKKDITPLQVVVSSPIALSLKSKLIVSSRLPYFRSLGKIGNLAANRKQSKSQVSLQTIIRSNKNNFVEHLCSSTHTHYHNFCIESSLKPL